MCLLIVDLLLFAQKVAIKFACRFLISWLGFYYMSVEFGWHLTYTLVRSYFKFLEVFINAIGNTSLLLCDSVVYVERTLNRTIDLYEPAFQIMDCLGCLLQSLPSPAPKRISNTKYKRRSSKERADRFCFRARCKGLNHCETGAHSRYHSSGYTRSFYQGSWRSQRDRSDRRTRH